MELAGLRPLEDKVSFTRKIRVLGCRIHRLSRTHRQGRRDGEHARYCLYFHFLPTLIGARNRTGCGLLYYKQLASAKP